MLKIHRPSPIPDPRSTLWNRSLSVCVSKMLFVRLRDTILFFIFYASFFFLFDSATAIVVVPRASNVRRTNEKGRSNSNRNAKKRMYETKKKNTHTDNLAVENAKKRNGKTKSNRNKKKNRNEPKRKKKWTRCRSNGRPMMWSILSLIFSHSLSSISLFLLALWLATRIC